MTEEHARLTKLCQGVTTDKVAGSSGTDLEGCAGKPHAAAQGLSATSQPTLDAGERPAPDSTLTARDAEIQRLREENADLRSPSVRADETGHMYRCVKVAGVWHCHVGCAKALLTAREGAARALREYVQHKDACDKMRIVAYGGDDPNSDAPMRSMHKACTCGLDRVLEFLLTGADGSDEGRP